MTGQVGYTYNVAGQRLTMSLPGGGTWSYTYSGPTLPKDDPNSAAQGLTTITDDQNRVVNYYLDTLGQTREVWSDQTFTGTQLTNSRGVVDHVRPGEMGDGRPARMERDDGCGGHCRANGCDTVALQRHW